MPTAPLAHLRVVDLTDLRAALAGRLLAELGAEVVKVEPPGGDVDRDRPPFVGDVVARDRSIPFLYRHAGKRGLTIDPTAAADRARFGALCDDADILLENFDAPGRAAWGLTPAAIAQRHPHLIHAAIADCGLDGPRAGWRLEALPAFAASGALFACGPPDRPPCWLPGYAAHDCAAAYALVGVLAAVVERARHGRGQTVEVSVQEAAIGGLNPWAITLRDYARTYAFLPTTPARNADGTYLVLPAADGWVRVAAATLTQWKAFVRLLGDPDELTGGEWESWMFRIISVDAIRAAAGERLRTRPRAAILADAVRLGVPMTALQTPDEFAGCEQVRARGFFRRTGFPHLGDAPFATVPFRFSRTPLAACRPAPLLGEDGAHGGGSVLARPDRPAADRARDGTPADGPVLAGTRVLDFGVAAVAPEVGWLLGELGADVIKIESRTKLDPLRAVALEDDGWDKCFTFNDENRGKASVLIDLATDGGRDLARRLCAVSDVVLDNNRGGVLARHGLDYDDVRRVRPDVVYLASQGYGRDGPLAGAMTFGPIVSAFAGAHWLWSFADAPYPTGSSLAHPDHVASKLGTVAVLAALEHRRRTGEGQLIDLAQTEAAAFLLGEFYLQGPLTGRPAGPQGNAADYASPHGVYPAAGDDRWLAIAVVGDDTWRRFRGVAEWGDEPALATLAGRLAARAALDARVAEWTRGHEAEVLAERLQAAGVSAMPVQHADDHHADPHLAARGAIVTVDHPVMGPERHAANPIRMSRTRLRPAGPSPCLGADTHAVLARVLGLSRARVDELAAAGVCR